MRGFVCTRGGTFGVVERNYRDGDGREAVVISWGPLGWLTPALESDCKQLSSRWEVEARAEAEAWIASLDVATVDATRKAGT